MSHKCYECKVLSVQLTEASVDCVRMLSSFGHPIYTNQRVEIGPWNHWVLLMLYTLLPQLKSVGKSSTFK
jgi:hypothetical protein